MTKAALYRKQGIKFQDSERKIKEAVEGIKNGTYKSCFDAAIRLDLDRMTVWRRFKGKTLSRVDRHMKQGLLNAIQEKILKN
jgi:hypothetical protein